MAMLAMTLSMSAAAPEGLITTQPEGQLYGEVYTSAREFLVYNNMPGRTDNTGYNTRVVINGNDIYLHNIIRDYEGLDSWIKGTITDSVAEFPLPQPIYYAAGTAADGSDDTVLYAEMFKAVKSGNVKDIVADTENPSLRMKWDGKSLTQILPGSSTDDLDYDGLCGMANSAHVYRSFGSQNIRMTIWDSKPAEPSAEITTSKYTLTFQNQWGSTLGRRVNVGFTDNEMWIQGLNTYLPESWVHGTIDADGNVTLASDQYLGLTQDYFMFFMAAEYASGNYKFTPSVILTKDGDNYSANSAMLINLGNEKVNGGDGMDMQNVTLTPFVEAPMTPADPMLLELAYEKEDEEDEYGISMLVFMIMPLDVNDVPLDTDRLFFNVFVDGDIYTFTPEKEFVPETITDIPYTWDNFDSYLMAAGDGLFIASVYGEVKSMGVQSFYLNGENRDNITRSAIMSDSFSGISTVTTDSPVVDTRYYNLNGIEVKNPAAGLFIKKTTRANGTIETTKTLIR